MTNDLYESVDRAGLGAVPFVWLQRDGAQVAAQRGRDVEALAKQVVTAWACWLDDQYPGWWLRCDPALVWMDLALLGARQTGLPVWALECAWMREVNTRAGV